VKNQRNLRKLQILSYILAILGTNSVTLGLHFHIWRLTLIGVVLVLAAFALPIIAWRRSD
jgi:hypothetical protein